MTGHLFIFGLGYTTARLARRLRDAGWTVTATRRRASGDAIAFDDTDTVHTALSTATHILSSVPPDNHEDPVLARYGAMIADSPARWIGYLSSTGVYGDTGGAWIDETAPTGTGRRKDRAAADAAWLALNDKVRSFRLPGIYGPGRSALDRVREGKVQRVIVPGQVFSRIHVDDIGSGVIASFDHGPGGAYNLTDDAPAPQADVLAHACQLLGVAIPPGMAIDDAGLSPAARAFYSENRRVANGKAKRLLAWQPAFADYQSGLTDIHLKGE